MNVNLELLYFKSTQILMNHPFCNFGLLFILLIIACSPQTSDVVNQPSNQDQVSLETIPKAVVLHQPEVETLPVDKRLRQGVLSNGIKYFIQQNVRPENRAELRLAVNAGSILEDEDQKGLAHFVEHMAFNGTENFEKSELVDYLESVGARFGPDLNAYTSFDETVYMLQVRTDSMDLYDKGLMIIKDWANGVTFEDEEIDKERGVVESEWRSRLSPDQRMQQQYLPVMYKGSRYADRLPIGDPDIINNADYATVKRFYKDWYRTDLMAVVVVGDIDIDATEHKIQSLFGGIQPSAEPRVRAKYDVPRHPETLVSVISDKEASFTNVRIVYKHDKVHTKTPEDYRKSLLRNVYNRMLSARLDEITKQPDPPFMFAASGYGGDIGDLDTYSSFAFVPEGKAALALEILLTENKRVLAHGYTSGELERAKKNMMERAEKGLKEMDKTESSQLAMRYVYKYLDEIPTPDPEQVLSLYETYLPAIKLEEVNRLAPKWIRDESRVIIITGPEKESSPLPEEGAVHALLEQVGGLEVSPYVDEVVEQPFFEKDLLPAEISISETFDDVDIDYLKLSNGVEVYLKQTDFKNDEILLRANSPGGTSLYDENDYFNASNAASIVSEAGIGVFNPVQIQKMLAGKSVSVRPYIGSLSEGFNGGSSPDDMEIMFQMIYKYFYEPKIDKEAFISFQTKQQGLYKNLMSNPQYFFQDYVSKTMYDNHPRVGFPDEEDWSKLNYDRVMEIYRERFSDASDFTFNIVGNFDKAEITSLIQKYLGNLPNTGREESWEDIGIRAVKGGLKDRIKKGEAPKTNVRMMFHGDFEYNRDNNYILSSMIAYLRIKLREELREDLGGVYGVGIFGGGSKKPFENYSISISFNADPPMTDTLVNAAKRVIQRAMEDGPDEADMTKVKETQRQSRIKDLKENRYWQRRISQEHEFGKQFEEILLESLEKRISGLTAAQIKAAVGDYFKYENYIEIIMDPEPKDSN